MSRHKAKTITEGARSLTQAGYDSCSTKVVPAGSILYTSRAPIGYVAIAGQPLCTNQGFKVFVPKDESLLSDFLYWYLKFFTPEIRAMGSGTTFLEISKKKAESIPIVIPPVDEQHRIVAAIEEQFSRIDAGVVTLERARRSLARLWLSVLASSALGRLVPQDPGDEPAQVLLARMERERVLRRSRLPSDDGSDHLPKLPASWTWALPDQLVAASKHALAIGPFGSNLKVSDYTDSGVPLVFVPSLPIVRETP